MLKRHFGKHAALIGVSHQYQLLDASLLPCHTLLSPILHHDKRIMTIESDFRHLPIATGSIDLALLPHTLELIDHPRQLIAEACRIIKPEGLIVISGFNPISMWGLRKLFSHSRIQPWENNFIQASKIKSWLKLYDFQLEQHQCTLYRPPVGQRTIFEKLSFLESAAKFLNTLGGTYVLTARAKVVPLTPIKMKWKQQLSGIRITPSLTGQIRAASE